jgi:hypothetical protein
VVESALFLFGALRFQVCLAIWTADAPIERLACSASHTRLLSIFASQMAGSKAGLGSSEKQVTGTDMTSIFICIWAHIIIYLSQEPVSVGVMHKGCVIDIRISILH